VAPDQLVEDALALGAEVLHQDEGHAAIGRYVVEESLEGLQPSGRRADAHHGEVDVPIAFRRNLRFLSRIL
jgi:hypothetical protein